MTMDASPLINHPDASQDNPRQVPLKQYVQLILKTNGVPEIEVTLSQVAWEALANRILEGCALLASEPAKEMITVEMNREKKKRLELPPGLILPG